MSGFGSFFRKYFRSLSIFLLILVVIGGLGYAAYRIVQSSNFRINTVNVSLDSTSQQYQNSMERYLRTDYLNMNKIILPRYQIKFRKYYLEKFPWIEKIQFTREKNTLNIQVIGKKPALYISIDNGLFAIADNRLFSVKNIANDTGTVIPTVEIISSDLSSSGSLNSLFFSIRIDNFVRQINLIYENISEYEAFQFIPGANKILLKNTDGIWLYFDARKNMIEQINKYKLITGSGAVIDGYKVIDLGTMDDIIFMNK